MTSAQQSSAWKDIAEQDLQWLDLKFRNDFDACSDWEELKMQEIISMAERMGRKELAKEMRGDLGIKKEQVEELYKH